MIEQCSAGSEIGEQLLFCLSDDAVSDATLRSVGRLRCPPGCQPCSVSNEGQESAGYQVLK